MPVIGTSFPWDVPNSSAGLDEVQGRTVTMIGDFNGDGINDFAIGAPYDDVYVTNTYTGYTTYGASFTYTNTFTQYNRGSVAVVFGNSNGLPPEIDLEALEPAQGFQIQGENSFTRFGDAIAAAGDVNGDGLADLIIGARNLSLSNSYSYVPQAGRGYVVFGSAAPVLDADGVMQAADLVTDGNGIIVTGGEVRGQAGSEVFEVGDFNGDGIDDIGIVIQYGDTITTTNTYTTYGGGTGTYTVTRLGSGQIAILPGSASGLPGEIDLAALPAGTILLENTGLPTYSGARYSYNPTQFGRDVDGGGDFDGDGVADVIVSAESLRVSATNTYSTYGLYSAGAAYVFFGDAAASGTTLSTAGLNGSTGFTFEGSSSGDRVGASVASLGDINGDGFDDYLIGATGADTQFTYTNVVINTYFSSYTNYVPGGYSFVGGYSNGVSYVGFGNYTSVGGGAYTYAPNGLYTMAPGYTNFGITTYFNTYTNTYTSTYFNTGQAYVLLGQASGMPATLNKDDLNSAQGFIIGSNGGSGSPVSTSQLGRTVAGVGDVNGDGYNDMMVVDNIYSSSGGSSNQFSRASLIFGSATPQTETVLVNELDGTEGYRFTFDASFFGRDLNKIDGTDLNGDGFSDIQFSRSGPTGYGTYYSQDDFTPPQVFFGGSNARFAYLDAFDGAQDGRIDTSLFGTNLFIADIFDETETGTNGADIIIGLDGNDTLIGRGGDDLLDGGEGNDTYRFTFATDGADTLFEASGSDTIDVMASTAESLSFRRSGTDLIIEKAGTTGKITVDGQYDAPAFRIETLATTSGSFTLKTDLSGTGLNEIFVGTSGAQNIAAGGGTDIIWAAGGDDTLAGGAGNDVLNGGDGNDTYRFAFATDNYDSLVETSGNDTIEVLASAAEDLSFRRAGTDLIIENAGTIGKLTAVDQFGAAGSRIETLATTSGSFVLSTGLTGTGLDEIFVGTSSGQLIAAGGGDDIVWAADGNDTVTGGAGDDRLNGGGGNDTYRFAFATDGQDSFVETSGLDTIEVISSAVEDLSFRRSGTDLIIEQAGTSGKITAVDQFGAASARIETLTTTSGSFSLKTNLTGTSIDEIFVGSSANDSIAAGGGIDIIVAAGGNDTINAGLGNDSLYGGSGNDMLTGGGGNDRIEGGTGNDRYVFQFDSHPFSAQGDGRDVISEINGGGTDTLDIFDREIAELGIRRSGTLLVLEDPDGTNRIVIEDHFSGIPTNRIEIIEANDGLRFFKTGLIGTATSDIIVGASGNETITGGGGDDIIVGGGAKDALYGGAGADVFVFAQVSDSTAAAAGRDTIFDFSQAEGDRIAVTAIDANTGLSGDNDFVFLGMGATSGAGTLAYSFAGGNTLVQADVDGGGADFSVLLAGQISLTATDFIL